MNSTPIDCHHPKNKPNTQGGERADHPKRADHPRWRFVDFSNDHTATDQPNRKPKQPINTQNPTMPTFKHQRLLFHPSLENQQNSTSGVRLVPWAAIRLKNGNTLITNESARLTFEVDPTGKTVWSFALSDLPSKYDMAGTQTCARLDNGNTIICSMGGRDKKPQLLEITPDKQVVWVLDDWRNLGPATAVQILTEAGVPENPGECLR